MKIEENKIHKVTPYFIYASLIMIGIVLHGNFNKYVLLFPSILLVLSYIDVQKNRELAWFGVALYNILIGILVVKHFFEF